MCSEISSFYLILWQSLRKPSVYPKFNLNSWIHNTEKQNTNDDFTSMKRFRTRRNLKGKKIFWFFVDFESVIWRKIKAYSFIVAIFGVNFFLLIFPATSTSTPIWILNFWLIFSRNQNPTTTICRHPSFGKSLHCTFKVHFETNQIEMNRFSAFGASFILLESQPTFLLVALTESSAIAARNLTENRSLNLRWEFMKASTSDRKIP